MSLRISTYNPEIKEKTLLVLFTLIGDKLEAVWEPDAEYFKASLERDGIVTGKGIFYPKDGKGFYDNLELAFSRSTMVQVEQVSRFVDVGFETMTVYDEDGNPILFK